MKEKISPFLSKIAAFYKSYIELCIWLLAFAIGIRLVETIQLRISNYDFVSNLVLNLTGLYYDIVLFLRVSVWITILFIAISFVNEKTVRTIIRILFSLMLLFSLICMVFFTTSGFLLDKVVFTYSFKEICTIILSSSKSPVWVYVVIIVMPVLFFYVSNKRIKIYCLLLGTFFALTFFSFFRINTLSSDTEHYLVKTNKAFFFGKSIFKRPAVFVENNEEIIKIVKEFRDYFPEHKFQESEFPFLYQAQYKDVLSSFFNLQPTPPNLVFIVVEGLGYNFLYNDYQLMPFLDSLSKVSLTWDNCLCAASRTFGVFPSIFGSAPLGIKGFMEQSPDNPEHHSLLRILHQNEYTSRFFYGGWTGFDNMKSYFTINNTSCMKTKDWDADILQQKIDAYWGIEDNLTYLQAHQKLNAIKSSPRIDIYLSLSTHDPFEYPNPTHFQEIVRNNVSQNQQLSEQQKKNILNSINMYGCFVYSDRSLQQLMKSYQNREDFENTIFIITGDHNAFAKQFGGYSNYHVPLIIYSPMIKSARKMKGVVSHRDITPTLISLLQNNFDIKTPEEVTWLNTALDTSLTFNANSFSPLQVIDHTVNGVMYKNYMLSEGILEEITDGRSRTVNDPDILKQMNRLLYIYQSLDFYVLQNNALIKNYYAHKQKYTDTINLPQKK